MSLLWLARTEEIQQNVKIQAIDFYCTHGPHKFYDWIEINELVLLVRFIGQVKKDN